MVTNDGGREGDEGEEDEVEHGVWIIENHKCYDREQSP